MSIISVSNLSKHFKVYKHHRGSWGAIRNFFSGEYNLVKAVDQITFNVQPGELIGYIGPNGAGKSTTIKMLTGLLVPSSGNISVNGQIPWKERITYVSRIGAVFGQRTTLWWDLPVIESLSLLQYIYNIPQKLFKKNLMDFQNLLDLDPFLDNPVRSLSLGQRMRADHCAALLHNPDILFLDEPTIGLHDLSDVKKLCDRVMILDHGRLLFDGNLSDLRNRFGGKRLLIVDFAEAYLTMKLKVQTFPALRSGGLHMASKKTRLVHQNSSDDFRSSIEFRILA
jgi:ABC-2 type transport system ATP-binding protein